MARRLLSLPSLTAGFQYEFLESILHFHKNLKGLHLQEPEQTRSYPKRRDRSATRGDGADSEQPHYGTTVSAPKSVGRKEAADSEAAPGVGRDL